MAERLVILGAGGHAKMVIEAAQSQGAYEPTLCLAHIDDLVPNVLGVAVEPESDQRLMALQRDGFHAFVAVGSNRLRRKLCDKLQSLGLPLATIISSRAWVSPSASIGIGTIVMPGAIIGAAANVGRGAIINTSASVDHDGVIGDYVHIAPGVHLAGCVTIGAGSFLGVGSSVIPERTIGTSSTVGAGAVVVRNIPDNQVWVGCPARFLKVA